MVKVGKVLTKEELLKENYELGQKIAKLEIQVEFLKDIVVDKALSTYKPVWPVKPIDWQLYPYVYPYIPGAGDDTTGDIADIGVKVYLQ